MPAFNFKSEFAAAVESGAKQQTIRAKRKNRPRVGSWAYCYTGMRTKACRLLGSWKISAVFDIIMSETVVSYGCSALSPYQMDRLALLDGFDSFESMRDWFAKTHGLPFHGDVIMWQYTRPALNTEPSLAHPAPLCAVRASRIPARSGNACRRRARNEHDAENDPRLAEVRTGTRVGVAESL